MEKVLRKVTFEEAEKKEYRFLEIKILLKKNWMPFNS